MKYQFLNWEIKQAPRKIGKNKVKEEMVMGCFPVCPSVCRICESKGVGYRGWE
jgi:hypothetical protein